MTRLPGGQIDLSPLGFGCAYLIGGVNARQSATLIDTVLTAGIQHFDVAPLYGLGTAEGVLGEALGAGRTTVSLASKVGISRPRSSRMALALRRLSPSLRARLRGFAARWSAPASGEAPATDFDPDRVRRSVDESLALLRTDYLDLLLLHEARVDDLSDTLLRYLDDGRRAGVFRAVGVGSNRDTATAIASTVPEFFDVFQYEWDVLKPVPPLIAGAPSCITHRSIAGAFDALRQRFATDPDERRRITEATGTDVADPDELGRLLLGAAIARNPGGVTLFGTRNPARITSNVVAREDRYVRGGAILADLLGARSA